MSHPTDPTTTPVAREFKELSDRLEKDGYDVNRLRRLADAVQSLQHPPTVIGRLRNSLRQTARQQWALLGEELAESKEALSLARSAVLGAKLSDSERDKVKSQLVDMLKLLPASVVATANTAIPIPGVGLLTPWLLRKLNLLPSRWREAHLLKELQAEHDALLEAGHRDSAVQLLDLRTELVRMAAQRRVVDRETQLLPHWDQNENGVWDDSERAAYEAEVETLRSLSRSAGHLKRWFLCFEGEIVGPMRFEQVPEYRRVPQPSAPESDSSRPDSTDHALTLICYQGKDKTGWIALDELVEQPP